MFRRLLLLSILLLCGTGSGCMFFEKFEPHQLWKLNRQPSMMREDSYFSIPAVPVPAESAATASSAEKFLN